ncbi:hypothetical protein GDO81_014375 [Engystomops pustulosus]|uniref:DET1- and DDB1-associated protein 1 n=1 Tax=Engystomops pustulosus TaxID=76066 RepID=A0AAV7B9T7_ENGPU|nr:hypothetical protein GDO81_014375 [Engystomops pustulosus]
MAQFLKNLPSHNEKNFSQFQPEPDWKFSTKKLPVHLPTTETPSQQSIVTDQTHILLRYLQGKAKASARRGKGRKDPGEVCERPAKIARTHSQDTDPDQ